MESFGRGGEAVGALVDRVSLGRPFRESIACVDRALQSRIKGVERIENQIEVINPDSSEQR